MTAEPSGERPVSFEACLEILAWGRNVYVVVRVPDVLAASARHASTRRLEGTLDGHAVNVGVNRADVIDGAFFYVGSGLRQRLGAHAGDLVECILAPADPDHVPLPDDVRDALEASGRRDAFERQPDGRRRRLLVPVEGAVRPATRERRIAALVAALAADQAD